MAFTPSAHTTTNKSIGVRGKPVDARTYYFDDGNTFRYRPYTSIQQVLSYLVTADDRRGNFDIIINTGGTLQSGGYILGGTNDVYWFKNGLTNADLILKVANVDLSNYDTSDEVDQKIANIALTPGPLGPQGVSGPQGQIGPQGVQGEIGPQGATGTKGDKGDTGATGPTGAQGTQGPQGIKGDVGLAGAQGPIGATGLEGIQGLKGDKGDTGDSGSDGTSVTILGTLPNTAALPATGDPGDGYLIAGFLWVWIVDAFENVGEIKGPKGDQGDAGPQGIQGPSGLTGPKGDTGNAGANGSQGIQGIQGVKGDQGTVGSTGPQGATGAKGDTGTQGPQGIQGLTGATGPQGVVGPQGPAGSDATVPDSTSSVKGKIKLAGDLGGTADNPTVPGLANKASVTSVTDEINARTLADTTESNNRINGDNALDAKINSNSSDILKSVIYGLVLPTVVGQNYIEDSRLIGMLPKWVVRGKPYDIGGTSATPTDNPPLVAFNIASGRITFDQNFYADETIGVLYSQLGNTNIIPGSVVLHSDFDPLKISVDKLSSQIFETDIYDTDYVKADLDGNNNFLGGYNSKGHFKPEIYEDNSIPVSAVKTLLDLSTNIQDVKKSVFESDAFDTDYVKVDLDGNDKFLGGYNAAGHFKPQIYAPNTIPKEALNFEIASSGGWPTTAFEALGLMAKRRIDIVEMMDSNGLHHGWGWNRGIEYALQTLGYKQYATPLYPVGQAGSQGLTTTGINPAAGIGKDVETPPGFELYSMPYRGVYLEAGSSIGTTNGITIDKSKNDTESPFAQIVATSALNRNSFLRYHLRYAEFAAGGGSFKLGIRREEAGAYTTLVNGEIISSVGSSNGIKITTLDLPEGDRDFALGAKIRNAGGYQDVPKNWFIDHRIEDVNAIAGFSTTYLFSVGGQSLWDMADFLINQKSLQQLKNFFEQIRRLQISKGQKPIVVMYINSGLNDQNETSSPSFGWRASTAPTSTEAYIDNLEAIFKRIEDVCEYARWDKTEFFWLIQPSHPIASPDATKLINYRKVAQIFANKPRMSFVDFNNITSFTEMKALGYYQADAGVPNVDYNHLTTPAYNNLAPRTMSMIIPPTTT